MYAHTTLTPRLVLTGYQHARILVLAKAADIRQKLPQSMGNVVQLRGTKEVAQSPLLCRIIQQDALQCISALRLWDLVAHSPAEAEYVAVTAPPTEHRSPRSIMQFGHIDSINLHRMDR